MNTPVRESLSNGTETTRFVAPLADPVTPIPNTIAELFFETVIGFQDSESFVLDGDVARNRFEEILVLLTTLGQATLKLFQLGDVTRDFHDSDNFTVRGVNRTCASQDVDLSARPILQGIFYLVNLTVPKGLLYRAIGTGLILLFAGRMAVVPDPTVKTFFEPIIYLDDPMISILNRDIGRHGIKQLRASHTSNDFAASPIPVREINN